MIVNAFRAFLLTCSIGFYSCGTLKDSPKYQLGDGGHLFKEKGKAYRKAYVSATGDSLTIYDIRTRSEIRPTFGQSQYFVGRSFDIDIMTVAFKYRPATLRLPRKLNTDFNGNVFLGYRLGRFKLSFRSTPAGVKKTYAHRGLTFGGFGGIGSTAMTPGTTNNLMVDEYNGLVLTRGLAFMLGINTLTVGVGVGWDYLTDRDKNIWIYQNKPWYGLTLGLNLN